MEGIANTPEKQAHYLHTIYNTAGAMDQLVDNLFWFSKFDFGKVPLRLERVSLADYFSDFCAEAVEPLKQDGMELQFENRCRGGTDVLLDRNQFPRVLRNLIDNSVKYRGESDKGWILITLADEPGRVVLEFADNGKGIDPIDADRIFESFYRADPARSSAIKGNGLGLAIVRQIIESMGGSISAKGSPNTGLTVRISLLKEKEGTA